MTIQEKLFNIQQSLIAPKNQFNSFGKYNYRSLEDIMVAVKPLLAQNKCNLTFEDSYIGEDTLSCYVTLHDCESDATIVSQAIVGIDRNKKGMDVAQSFGASSSYGRKYAANGLFLIDDTKDADATNKHGKVFPSEDVSKGKTIPALVKGSEQYAKAAEYIAKGGKIDDIKKKYYLSTEVEEALSK